jgi:TIGR03009 family protein
MQQPARAPFQLTPKEHQDLDRVWIEWQRRSQAIKSFTCSLKRWEWDAVFQKKTTGVGDLKYSAPDNGLYRVKDEKTGEMIDHWVCDGKSLYEFNSTKKEVIERVLPPNMQGQAIADGPLPFIFGADAAKLKQRYWMRLIAPPEKQEDKICIEAFPRTQQDAANFKRAELLLNRADMLPFALQIDLTNGKNWTVHQFYSIVTNDPLRGIKDIFLAPRVFPPWKKILDNPETIDPEPAGGADQARVPPQTLPQ